jgi:hypothetical protein
MGASWSPAAEDICDELESAGLKAGGIIPTG